MQKSVSPRIVIVPFSILQIIIMERSTNRIICCEEGGMSKPLITRLNYCRFAAAASQNKMSDGFKFATNFLFRVSIMIIGNWTTTELYQIKVSCLNFSLVNKQVAAVSASKPRAKNRILRSSAINEQHQRHKRQAGSLQRKKKPEKHPIPPTHFHYTSSYSFILCLGSHLRLENREKKGRGDDQNGPKDQNH